MIATLPMYDWPELHEANTALWTCLRNAFCEAGFEAPEHLSQAEEGKTHWLRPDLLFSQTCGYPFAADLLGKVELLATPVYGVKGCGAGTYRSAIIVSRDSQIQTLKETKGRRFAFNGRNSLSGFRCMIPKIGDPNIWFSTMHESGAHRQSAKDVATGSAEVAAIDAICWAYIQKFDAEIAEQLRVLDWTDEFPALPFISAKSENGKEAAMKKRALEIGIENAVKLGVTAPLKLKGLLKIPAATYAKLNLLTC